MKLCCRFFQSITVVLIVHPDVTVMNVLLLPMRYLIFYRFYCVVTPLIILFIIFGLLYSAKSRKHEITKSNWRNRLSWPLLVHDLFRYYVKYSFWIFDLRAPFNIINFFFTNIFLKFDFVFSLNTVSHNFSNSVPMTDG